MLTDNLLKKRYCIRSLDLFLYNNNECVLNYLGDPNYEFMYGDIVDPGFIRKVLDGVECVIVLSGLVGDPITKKYPEESALINDQGVKNIIDRCAELNIDKFIFVSTCSNYGFDNKRRGDANSATPANFAAKKIERGARECNCLQFLILEKL